MDIEKIKKIFSKQPRINGEKEYLNCGVLVPLIFINDEYHLLFEKRSHSIKQETEICFPGGKYNPKKDLSYKETAIRETIEELGVSRDQIEILGKLDIVIAPMGVMITPFLAVLNMKSLKEGLNINKDEVGKALTIPLQYFLLNDAKEYKVLVKIYPSYIDNNGRENILLPVKELGLPQKYHTPWGNNKYKVFAYNFDKEIIWGITARIIYNFINNIRELPWKNT